VNSSATVVAETIELAEIDDYKSPKTATIVASVFRRLSPVWTVQRL